MGILFQQAIDKIIPIRLHSYEELLGADYFEHDIRHPSVGVSRLQNIFAKVDLSVSSGFTSSNPYCWIKPVFPLPTHLDS